MPGVLINQFGKLAEKVVRVVRAGRGLGMILHAENGMIAMPHSLDGLVVQINVCDFHVRRQRVRIDGEAVILRRDRDAPGRQVLHRLVATVMPELQFESFAAKSETEHLMPEANSEYWCLADQVAHIPMCIV